MKTQTSFFHLFFATVLFFSFSSCKKENKVETCNPSTSFKAGIKIGYKFLDGSFVAADTVINFSVFIDADSTYESYHWQVGNDTTVRSSKAFTLRFNIAQLGETFPVTLIAKGKKNPCNATDDGIDTVQKSFTLLYSKELNELNYNVYPAAYSINLPFFGQWKGAFEDNKTDSFVVTINNNGRFQTGMEDRFFDFRVYNLPKGCSVKQQSGVATCEPVTDTIQKYFGYPITEISYNGFYVQRYTFLECCPLISMNGSVNTFTGIITIKCMYLNGSGGITRTRFFNARKY